MERQHDKIVIWNPSSSHYKLALETFVVAFLTNPKARVTHAGTIGH